MAQQGWTQSVANMAAAGPSLATFTTAATALNKDAIWIAPSNFFNAPRQQLMIDVWGGETHLTGCTFTFEVRFGPTANIVVFTTGALAMTTTTHGGQIPWHLKMLLNLSTIGSGTSAAFKGQGFMWGQGFAWAAGADNAAGTGFCAAPNTAPANGTGFDSTVANQLELYIACGTSSASNGIQVHEYSVLSLN